jgi:hypothetical protein
VNPPVSRWATGAGGAGLLHVSWQRPRAVVGVKVDVWGVPRARVRRRQLGPDETGSALTSSVSWSPSREICFYPSPRCVLEESLPAPPSAVQTLHTFDRGTGDESAEGAPRGDDAPAGGAGPGLAVACHRTQARRPRRPPAGLTSTRGSGNQGTVQRLNTGTGSGRGSSTHGTRRTHGGRMLGRARAN